MRDLVKNADNNVDLAEYGIIYIDEIDKLARKAGKNGGMDVSGRGVQINLLKLMEDTEVSLTSQNDIAGQMESMMAMMNGGSGPKRKKSISTKHILFIVSGAFDKLDENIRERLVGSEIGFGRTPSGVDQDTSDFLKKVETRDLVEYGLEPEFVGRIPVRVICEKLSAGHLYEILKNSEGSVLKQYQSEFKGYDIDMSISEDALQDIAARAAGELTGARGLVTILEKIFRNFKFELPSTNIKELEVSAKTISDPEGSLSEILDTYKEELPEQLLKEIQEFADRFERENQIKLKFTDKAMQLLSKESTETDKTIRSICEQKFHDYQYGLTLIARNSEQNTFLLDENAIENPDEVLSKWIVEHYRKEGAAE